MTDCKRVYGIKINSLPVTSLKIKKFDKKSDNKDNVEYLVKVIYRVPKEMVFDKKILQPGDVLLAGRATIEEVREVRPAKGEVDYESAYYKYIIVLLKADCVILNNEIFCANTQIKINSSLTLSNPFYFFPNGTIIDIEAKAK